jgi:hypothetical protein
VFYLKKIFLLIDVTRKTMQRLTSVVVKPGDVLRLRKGRNMFHHTEQQRHSSYFIHDGPECYHFSFEEAFYC